jgi:predicted LPLAT superfamily acyltransferase
MAKWDGKTKGKALGYKIFVFFIKAFGIAFSYFILEFVSYYYYLFHKSTKEILLDFYISQLNKTSKEAKVLARKNFRIFGQIMIDRIAFLSKIDKKYTYSFENENYISSALKEGKGLIMISGHVGNWETAGNLLQKRLQSPINVVMYDEEVQKIQAILDNSTKIKKFNIIPIKNDLSHVIAINNALSRNEIIALHGDRFMSENQTISIDFLNDKAQFPKGPFILSSKFKAPTTFVYAVKTGKYHYHFSATQPIQGEKSEETIAKAYVKTLEEKVTENPEQWFNFFKFHN